MQTLVPLHGAWRYAYDGVDQGTNWRTRAFDDSNWDTGQTLFGFESAGIYFEPFSTILPDPATRNFPITTYFRASFNLMDPAATNVLFYLTNWIDDGAVFYINGMEVARLRLTDNPVEYRSLASPPIPEGRTDVLAFGCTNCPLFAEGNVLAVEVHQNATNSSDIVFGSILSRETLHPLVIVNEPDDVTVSSNAPARLEVVVEGSYPRFQWYRNGVALNNQTNPVYQIANARPADSAAYHVVATNEFGSTVTSRVATINVVPDTTAPVIVYAVVPILPINSNKVEILFFDTAGIASATANRVANYRVHRFDTGEQIGITQAQFSGGRTRLVLDRNWDKSQTYVLTVNGVADPAGNLIKPNTQVIIQFERVETLFGFDDPLWSFTGPPEEPAGWKDFNYFEDPGLWSRGRAILVCDTSAWEPCEGSRVTALNCGPTAHYFRTTFVNSNAPRAATLLLRSMVDDGAVYYVNGVEIGRYNMPTGPITYSSRAPINYNEAPVGGPGCQPLSFAVTNLLLGTNLLCVEVHQATDFDVAFGLGIDLQYIAAPTLTIPSLRIDRSNAVIQVWWPGRPWALETRTNLSGAPWQRLDAEEVPFIAPGTGQQFFQVRQP